MDNLTKQQMSSALLSKFCAVDVLVGLVNLSALRNIEVSANQRVICTGLYRQAVRTMLVGLDNHSPQFREPRIGGSTVIIKPIAQSDTVYLGMYDYQNNTIQDAPFLKRKVICYQLELGKQLADVSTERSSRHQGEKTKIQLKRRQDIFRALVGNR